MGRKDRWGSSGPEPLSIADYCRAVNAFHGAVVKFEIYPTFPTMGHAELTVSAVAQPGAGPELASGPLKPVSVAGRWPCSDHSTLEGLMYKLIMQLDHKVGTEWWSQRELPF